jgi:hypothetical protein
MKKINRKKIIFQEREQLIEEEKQGLWKFNENLQGSNGSRV